MSNARKNSQESAKSGLSKSHKSSRSKSCIQAQIKEPRSLSSRKQEKSTILSLESKECAVYYLFEAAWIKE